MNECDLKINESDLELKTKLDNIFTNSSQQNDFKPRDLELENKKSTRNCTKNVEFELKTRIVKTVLEKLLNKLSCVTDCSLTKFCSTKCKQSLVYKYNY